MGVIKRITEAIFGKTTPAQRATATGLVPGHPIANHHEEGNKVRNWNYVAQHAVAKEAMQATISVSVAGQQTVTKSIAQDSPDESSTPDNTHPIAKLLDRPNPMTSGQEFLYQYEMQLRTTGGVIIWDVRDSQNRPVELYILPMAWLAYQIPTEDAPMGRWRVYSPRGMLGYFGNHLLANGFYIDVRETFNPKYSHPLYLGEPLSPLTQCAQIIDIAEKSEEAVVGALANSIRPSIVLSFKRGTPPEAEMERLKASLAARNAGVHRTGEALLVGEDVDVKDLSQRMAELDAVNVREQNQKFNFQVQAVPSIATGGDNSGTYSGNAATINTHVELSIQPDLDLLAGKMEVRWSDIYPGLKIEINAKRMDDPTLQLQRSDKILAAVDKGAASVNEWRSSMKLPPIPDGDKYEKTAPPGGMPGAAPGAPPPDAAGGGPLDVPELADDPADSDGTGVVDPMRQGMPTQKRLAWLANGFANGGH